MLDAQAAGGSGERPLRDARRGNSGGRSSRSCAITAQAPRRFQEFSSELPTRKVRGVFGTKPKENSMATLLVKHRVANFEEWKKVFDGMDHVCAGSTDSRAAPCIATPPTRTWSIIVNHVRTLDGAKKYGGSQELRDAMAHAGVQGMPEISFLNDVG